MVIKKIAIAVALCINMNHIVKQSSDYFVDAMQQATLNSNMCLTLISI